MKRRKASIVVPFVGDGKLTQYKNKKDSWIYNQMEKGEYKPGIEIVDGQFMRFSFVKNKIASQILSDRFDYKKQYRVISDRQIQMTWSLYSKIDNSTIEQLNEVSDMLKNFSDYDLLNVKNEYELIEQVDTDLNVKIENSSQKIYLKRNIVLVGEVENLVEILQKNFFEEI